MKAKLTGLDLRRQQRLVEIVRNTWRISVPEFAKFLELNPKTVADYFTRTRITAKNLPPIYFLLSDEIFHPTAPKEKEIWINFLDSPQKKNLERKKKELRDLLKSKGVTYDLGDVESEDEKAPETEIGVFIGAEKPSEREDELALQNRFLLDIGLETSKTLVAISDPDLRWLIFKDPEFGQSLLELLENLETTIGNVKSQVTTQLGRRVKRKTKKTETIGLSRLLGNITMTLAVTDTRTLESLTDPQLQNVEDYMMSICARLITLSRETRELMKKKESDR